MAFADTTWYCNAGDQSTTGYYAVAKSPRTPLSLPDNWFVSSPRPRSAVSGCLFVTVAGDDGKHDRSDLGAHARGEDDRWHRDMVRMYRTPGVNGDLTNTQTGRRIRPLGSPTLGGRSLSAIMGSATKFARRQAVGGPNRLSAIPLAPLRQTAQLFGHRLGPVTNFTGGQAPHARLANACATNWFAAGNTVYVGDNHAESQATAITISPCRQRHDCRQNPLSQPCRQLSSRSR